MLCPPSFNPTSPKSKAICTAVRRPSTRIAPRYAEFLKTDFPRVPLTSERKLFAKLADKGAELVALHLLKSPALDEPITTFTARGTNVVERVEHVNKRVNINK